MSDKVSRIHPEMTEPQQTHYRFTDMVANPFYNPYPSREEYDRREQRFLAEQSTLLSPLTTLEGVLANNNDISFAMPTGIYFDPKPRILLLEKLGYRVFGDLLRQRSQKMIYNKNDEDAGRNVTARSLFEPGQLFFGEEDVDERVKAYFLMRNHLTPEEIVQCAQRAFDFYDIIEFSRVHYRNKRDPLKYFLEQIVEVGAKLDPEKFPEWVYEAEAEGFLQNEYSPQGRLLVRDAEDDPIFLTNCHKEFHGNLVRDGDRVRFVMHMYERGETYDTGTLIDVL